MKTSVSFSSQRVSGTIVKDFDSLLAHILDENGILVGKKKSLFQLSTLTTLNSLLTRPIKQDQERPIQKNFPHLNALNALLQLSGLVRSRQRGKDSFLFLDEKTLESWKTLNEEEKYFHLFSLLFYSEFGEVTGTNRERYMPFAFTLSWLFENSQKEWKFSDYSEQTSFSYLVPSLHLGALDLFGFLSIEEVMPERGKGWRYQSITVTDFGKIMLQELSYYKELTQYALSDDEIIDVLKKKFSSCFPTWQKNLVINFPQKNEGTYLFKVTLLGSWSLLAIDGSSTLDQLASLILEAFNFDNDHLYYFQCKDWRGIEVRYYHSYTSDVDFYAEDYSIDSLSFTVGQPITFLFDFGDSWEFTVKLQNIEKGALDKQSSKVLKSGGAAPPRQYFY